MQLPSRKPPNLMQGLGCLEHEQELSQLVGHGSRHAFDMVVLMELPQSFMAKTGKAHFAPSLFSMYGYTVHVKRLLKAGLDSHREGFHDFAFELADVRLYFLQRAGRRVLVEVPGERNLLADP